MIIFFKGFTRRRRHGETDNFTEEIKTEGVLARVQRQVFNNVGQGSGNRNPTNNCKPVSKRVCRNEPVSNCRNVPRQRCQLNRGNCSSTPQRYLNALVYLANGHSFKYQRFTPSGCKGIGISNIGFIFVTNAQLLNQLNIYDG